MLTAGSARFITSGRTHHRPSLHPARSAPPAKTPATQSTCQAIDAGSIVCQMAIPIGTRVVYAKFSNTIAGLSDLNNSCAGRDSGQATKTWLRPSFAGSCTFVTNCTLRPLPSRFEGPPRARSIYICATKSTHTPNAIALNQGGECAAAGPIDIDQIDQYSGLLELWATRDGSSSLFSRIDAGRNLHEDRS